MVGDGLSERRRFFIFVVMAWFRLAAEGHWIGIGLALDWESCGLVGV